MQKDWIAIISVMIALIIVGFVYVRGPLENAPVTGSSIDSLSGTSTTTQTILGITLLFVLIISIFFMVNTSLVMLQQNFHK